MKFPKKTAFYLFVIFIFGFTDFARSEEPKANNNNSEITTKSAIKNLKKSENLEEKTIDENLLIQSLGDVEMELPKKGIFQEDQSKNKLLQKLGIKSRLVADIGVYDNYLASDQREEFLDSQLDSRMFSEVRFAKGFSLYSLARISRVENQKIINQSNSSINGSRNRNFENLALYLQEINLRYQYRRNSLVIGKYAPNFGNGWRFDRGISLKEIPSQYKQAEKLGVANSLQIGDAKKTGLYQLNFGLFKNDRSFLHNSLFNNRDGAASLNGKAGSTNNLSSYIISANINFDFKENEKLAYHFSWLKLRTDKGDSALNSGKIKDQQGAAYGISYDYPVQDKFQLYSMLEYVEMKYIDGNSDISNNYFTANIGGKLQNGWMAMLGNSTQKNQNISAIGFDKSMTELNFGYDCKKTKFFNRLTAQIGYQKLRTNYRTYQTKQNAVAFLLRYYQNF